MNNRKKYKVGVIGSSANEVSEEDIEKVKEIGLTIAREKCFLLSGASFGLPYEAVKAAKKAGGFTVGISPASNLREHVEKYKFPVEYFDLIVFTGFGFKGRNVVFVRSCDAVIMVSGRTGTLNEFTIAFDENRVIGVLESSRGVTKLVKEIVRNASKKGGPIIYSSNPKELVKKVKNHLDYLNSTV